MTRAMQTAQPIAEALGMKPEVWVDVHEIGGLFLSDDDDNITGFPGLSRSEMSQKFPNYVLTEAITEAGWWDVSKGLELPPNFIARAIRVSQLLHDRAHLDERIAIVSHAGFIDVLIKAFLSQIPTHPNILFYTHYNTAISRLDFGEGYQGKPSPAERVRLHYLNRVNHLPPELWTW
jgi:broad specificity phosphatase PhoE